MQTVPKFYLSPAAQVEIKQEKDKHIRALEQKRKLRGLPRLLAVAAFVCAAAASATTAAAAEYAVVVHGASHHFTERAVGKWNESNLGLGMRAEFDKDLSAQAGFYHNSEYRTSAYALADYTPLHIGPVSMGGFAGVATGYAKPIVPVAGAVARMQLGRTALALRLAPKSGIGGSAVASIELAFKF
jgi:hypothetical protein